MKINCKIKIGFKDEKESKAILRSIEVDNLEYINSRQDGRTIITNIESKSISSLIHTLDDYLSCVSVAEKIFKK
jgi:tRNA threonylcarbamoyladenosine modification (KEOPS) complex  Pcc1 subunit